MSVIVKGMEMPNACCHCPCSDSAGCAVTGRVMTTEEMAGQLGDIDDCPLHPLPEKHGRLIDADDFSAVMKERQLASAKWLREAKDAETINRAGAVFAVLCEVKRTIGKLPTIVEAEGE